MRLLQLVLIASVLAAEEGPPATASGRRAWYSASLRSCTLGSSGVIIPVNEAAVRRRLKSTNQTVSPAAHFAAKISSRANVDRVFTLIPAIHATVSNASLEQILDDDEASTIEADCVIRLSLPVTTDEELKQAYSMRRLSVQTSAPWNLDAIDQARFDFHTGRCPGITAPSARPHKRCRQCSTRRWPGRIYENRA